MTNETIFSLINASVVPAWLLLMFAPRWPWTHRLVHAAYVPLLFGVFYSYFFALNIFFGGAAEGTSLFSLAGVMALFDSETGTLVGWSHYLVFDLFVGAWISRDALRRGVNYLAVIPCLLFTFMAGPIGLMLYLLLRLATGKGGMTLAEDSNPG